MLAPNKLEWLRRDGVIRIGMAEGVHDIAKWLEGEETMPGHVRRPTPQNSPDTRCYSFEQVLNVPGFLKYAMSFTPFVREYLNTNEPLLYSVNAFWTQPAEKTHPGLQEFHRDKDDSRFVALFIYGTDIFLPADGPHQYVVGTQDGKERGPVMTLYGPAGFAFMADGRGLHRGLMPKERGRLLAWARWGVSDPPMTYKKDGCCPVPKSAVPDYPTDPYLQKLIRLVAA